MKGKKYFLASSLSGFVALFLDSVDQNIFDSSRNKIVLDSTSHLEVYTGLLESFWKCRVCCFIAYLLGTYYFIKVFSENKKMIPHVYTAKMYLVS
jgi:hypothetical protein